MTAIDAGAMVAVLNRRDKYHEACRTVLPALALPFITTPPALTEAMYFLGETYGWPGQARLWEWMGRGQLRTAFQRDEDLARMRALMERYADTPMDFADASLVALLEAERLDTIFTTDSHFRAYRLANRRVIRVTPDTA